MAFNLYFLNANSEEILVKENVGPGADGMLAEALTDLKDRDPEFKSFYQRCWWDDHQRFWIDFGSHTEFYICHEEKGILEKENNKCAKGYCEFDL
jgi:hypothetical protein